MTRKIRIIPLRPERAGGGEGMVTPDDGRDIVFAPPADRNLPPFSGDTTACAKCREHAMHYVEWVPLGAYTARGSFGECLERTCRRCGYTWAEAVIGE